MYNLVKGSDRMKLIFLVILVLFAIVVFISYCCYRMAFYVRRGPVDDSIHTPEGEIYDPYRNDMVRWILETRQMKTEDFYIQSDDGLKLHGRFYEFAPGAPIELMFHGYRGSAERDLSGGVQRCFKLGRSALLVDQRCSNESDGRMITFGIKEHKDCLRWVDFMIGHFGPDVKIILCGISMGASTVMMAAGHELPKNVIGVLADCGFNCAKDIMYSVIHDMGLPPAICYPFVKLGARIFAGFDLEEYSAQDAMQTCSVPVIFFHGMDDDFVPCWMSQKCYDMCNSKKEILLVPGAGHGLSYPVAPQQYLSALKQFFGPEASAKIDE